MLFNSKRKTQNAKLSWLLLLLWLAIGMGLRCTQLESKSPWTDEFSSMVFSLGNSFRTVPLDRAIALDILLQPLQSNPHSGIKQVVGNLLLESNHPPLYFVLAHLWMKLFPSAGGMVSLWVARSLPALLGTASIPAIYGLAYLAFRSRLVSHLAAALMAVSPYGIFLAQEARHYTLATLWAIASLSCLMVAVRHMRHQKPLPTGIAPIWVTINGLGIATHYFFALTLCAEAIVLLVLGWRLFKQQRRSFSSFLTLHASLLGVALGTMVAGLVWLPLLQNGYDSELIEWIKKSDRIGLEAIAPIFQALAAWITMLSLLPVESSALSVVLVSGFVMIVFFLWALPILYRGIKAQYHGRNRVAIQTFGGFVLAAIALFFSVTYGLGIDLTRGARYNFVYFPAVILVVAASLAVAFQQRQRKAVALVWLMGLVSGLTVVSNLGYQKYYRPDLFVPLTQQTPEIPVLIATTHQTHVQTGELMGIAWEFKRWEQRKQNQAAALTPAPQFLLAHQEQDGSKTATLTLQKTLAGLPRPLNLWLVNFHAPVELAAQNCVVQSQSRLMVDGYDYQLYRCLPDSKVLSPES